MNDWHEPTPGDLVEVGKREFVTGLDGIAYPRPTVVATGIDHSNKLEDGKTTGVVMIWEPMMGIITEVIPDKSRHCRVMLNEPYPSSYEGPRMIVVYVNQIRFV